MLDRKLIRLLHLYSAVIFIILWLCGREWKMENWANVIFSEFGFKTNVLFALISSTQNAHAFQLGSLIFFGKKTQLTRIFCKKLTSTRNCQFLNLLTS